MQSRRTGVLRTTVIEGQGCPPPETVRGRCERRSMHVLRPIRVSNARGSDRPPTLHHGGFALVESPTRVGNLHDRQAVESEYLRECIRLCERLTGCRRAAILQYQYRKQAPERPVTSGRARVDGYETLLHVDVTPYSEIQLDFATGGRHFQIYNFWRNCRRDCHIEHMPLALCDMSSVNPDDMVFAEFHLRHDPPVHGLRLPPDP